MPSQEVKWGWYKVNRGRLQSLAQLRQLLLRNSASGLSNPIKVSPGDRGAQGEPGQEAQRRLCGFFPTHLSTSPDLVPLLMETPQLVLAAWPQETGCGARRHCPLCPWGRTWACTSRGHSLQEASGWGRGLAWELATSQLIPSFPRNTLGYGVMDVAGVPSWRSVCRRVSEPLVWETAVCNNQATAPRLPAISEPPSRSLTNSMTRRPCLVTSSSSHSAEGNELREAIRGGLFTYRDPGRQQPFDQTFPVLASMKQKFP